ncbi:hypothetical protein BDR03DRAFT_849408 [Suillus americanus]|nr:hypothetical protein BDR03DRAFT_849408 [Suillus americanus]
MGNNKTWRKQCADSLAAWRASKKVKDHSNSEPQNDEKLVNLSFATRSAQFINAYKMGLNGTRAAWAIKKYRGHRVLPPTIMQEFDDAH